MHATRWLSFVLTGLSTIALCAQGAPGAADQRGVASSPEDAARKPDVNELIRTATRFTNHVGMVLVKAGSLWVSEYEVTQKVYQEIIGSNPSVTRGEDHPVDSVSWNAAVQFCERLTASEYEHEMLPDGYEYRLPTQAQWEMLAAGVGLDQAVTSSRVTRSGTAPVGTLAPSAAGVYDLRGNVAEWCADPSDQAFRVLRGGSWRDWIEVNLRPEFRIFAPPTEAKDTYGFRCVLVKE